MKNLIIAITLSLALMACQSPVYYQDEAGGEWKTLGAEDPAPDMVTVTIIIS